MVDWSNDEKSQITYSFDQNWTWSDFEIAVENGFSLIEGVDHQVHVIFDLSNTTDVPNGIMIYWRKMLKALPKNHGVLVIIAQQQKVRIAVELFLNINQRFANRVFLTESEQQAQALISAHPSGDQLILVVEDDGDLRANIVDMVSLEGYKVISVDNGLDALTLAQKYQPVLIISDIMMPQLDGFKLTDTLRNQPETEHIPIIMLTARAERAFIRHGMELGADDYITKPFHKTELLSSIKARLRRIQSTKEA